MRFQAITQIIFVALSLVIIFTVIRPMFGTIQENQNEVEKFQEALAAASQFNARLAELQSRANSFSPSNLNALETYIPAEIDILSVSRDIAYIAEENQLLIQTLEAEDVVEDAVEDGSDVSFNNQVDENGISVSESSIIAQSAEQSLRSRRFSFEAIGTYEQMKQAMIDYERNAYPLRLVGLEFSAEDEGSTLYNFAMEFETYALNF
ncbi:MAG: hypothetical protein WDZ68_00345 [Candidatus Paceibacterota bacterium]